LVGAVKASAALSLLLLLKQYMFRAYRLTEERGAGLASNAHGRKNEAKISAMRVGLNLNSNMKHSGIANLALFFSAQTWV
jgi:hypothetical protein